VGPSRSLGLLPEARGSLTVETREDQKARILAVMYDGDWHRPTDLPGHRRRCYSILIELTRAGIAEDGIQRGSYAWRLRKRTIPVLVGDE